MLEQVTISDTKDGFIKVEQKDETGICIAVCVVPEPQWRELKNQFLSSGKLNGDFSTALSYLLGLWVLLEQS